MVKNTSNYKMQLFLGAFVKFVLYEAAPDDIEHFLNAKATTVYTCVPEDLKEMTQKEKEKSQSDEQRLFEENFAKSISPNCEQSRSDLLQQTDILLLGKCWHGSQDICDYCKESFSN